jgi:hypothetical protein
MSLSWKIRNSLLWLATAGMGAAACFGIPSTTKWLKDSQETKSNAGEAIPKPASKRSTLDLPTEEELERASSVNLQRMNPPKALPPPAKPVVVAEPPPQVPVVLFQGTLVGTIEDSDPKYCFALLKGTDNRVKLVAQGQKIDSDASSATLVTINAKEVTLKLGEQQQTLKVIEGP